MNHVGQFMFHGGLTELLWFIPRQRVRSFITLNSPQMCHQPDIHVPYWDFFTPACSCMHPPPSSPLLPAECLVQLQIMHSRHMLCAIPTILLVLRYVRCIIYWNAIRHFALQKCHVLVSAAGREHVRDSDGTGIRQRWRWWCWQAPKWRIGLFKRQAHLLRFYLSWQIYVQASILFFARCTMCHNN